jgi:hypothetical protein
MSYETLLNDIRKEMAGEPAAVQIEYRIDALVREMDELCALAANAETVDLVEQQKIGIGRIATRSQLILSLLLARKPSGLRIVKNG